MHGEQESVGVLRSLSRRAGACMAPGVLREPFSFSVWRA